MFLLLEHVCKSHTKNKTTAATTKIKTKAKILTSRLGNYQRKWNVSPIRISPRQVSVSLEIGGWPGYIRGLWLSDNTATLVITRLIFVVDKMQRVIGNDFCWFMFLLVLLLVLILLVYGASKWQKARPLQTDECGFCSLHLDVSINLSIMKSADIYRGVAKKIWCLVLWKKSISSCQHLCETNCMCLL